MTDTELRLAAIFNSFWEKLEARMRPPLPDTQTEVKLQCPVQVAAQRQAHNPTGSMHPMGRLRTGAILRKNLPYNNSGSLKQTQRTERANRTVYSSPPYRQAADSNRHPKYYMTPNRKRGRRVTKPTTAATPSRTNNGTHTQKGAPPEHKQRMRPSNTGDPKRACKIPLAGVG
ncbi:Hypothetical predicted protein [Pelobates cultripes]|uniref:Uncharacterized protein n=1 Tax=Pelobates cultripes TaxID=61616 RepID=A0AAD1VRP2_PELCU|nr:Hypothetical predicted protein [Pelobates cultripes]